MGQQRGGPTKGVGLAEDWTRQQQESSEILRRPTLEGREEERKAFLNQQLREKDEQVVELK
jgi:hypothetical protein